MGSGQVWDQFLLPIFLGLDVVLTMIFSCAVCKLFIEKIENKCKRMETHKFYVVKPQVGETSTVANDGGKRFLYEK